MIRIIFWLSYIVRRIQGFLGHKLVGARAIVFNAKTEEVLLVYHTYCPDWYLPGGGVKRSEHPQEAIKRELFEEAGVRCLESPKFLGMYYQNYMGVDDYPCAYRIDHFHVERVRSPEIKEVRWFSIKDLPEDMNPASKRRIEEEFFGREKDLNW